MCSLNDRKLINVDDSIRAVETASPLIFGQFVSRNIISEVVRSNHGT